MLIKQHSVEQNIWPVVLFDPVAHVTYRRLCVVSHDWPGRTLSPQEVCDRQTPVGMHGT